MPRCLVDMAPGWVSVALGWVSMALGWVNVALGRVSGAGERGGLRGFAKITR